MPEGAKQYVFQSWSETLTGIEQKITYLDEHGMPIKNAIILIDIPGSFCEDQNPKEALTIKDYHFSGQSKLAFEFRLFYNFIQKPSVWIKSITTKLTDKHPEIGFDTISNDWEKGNRFQDLQYPPKKDSLTNCSAAAKNAFLSNFYATETQTESESLLTDELLGKLDHVAAVLKNQNTSYQIIITPAPCYTSKKINSHDLDKLQKIFGSVRVHDYSGVNEYTKDCYNFSDPNHFGLYVGWKIIDEIFHSEEMVESNL